MPSSFPPETFSAHPESSERAPGGYPGYPYGHVPRPPLDFAAQLREWVDVLARGRWIIALAVVLAAIPSIAYALLAPDQYQAAARLYVETESGAPLSGVLPTDGAQAAFGQDIGISNELYILQNAEDLSQSVARDLLERAETGEASGLTVLETEDGALPTLDALADRIAFDYVRVQQDGQGVNGVKVSATSTSPEEAALIANLYAEAYVDRTRNSSRASVSASREFLEAQVDSTAAELSVREEAAREYMDREGAVRLDEEASTIVSQLATLEAALDQSRVEAGMEAARSDELRQQIRRLEGSVAQRLGSGADEALSADRERLGTLRANLETIYFRTPSLRDQQAGVPSEVADLRRQIATLEARIREQNDRLADESIAAGGVDAATTGLPRLSALRDRLTESEVTLRGLRSRIATLERRIGAREAELSRVPEQTVELARLVRERESAERLAVGLDQKLQEARVAESAELGYAEVVRSADPPRNPFAPNRTRTVLLGLLLGLGVGVALAIGQARLDQAIRRPDQLRELGHPVLGVVPDVTKVIADEFDGDETVPYNGRQIDSHLVALLSPMSTAAEAFRGLRTSLQFSRPDAPIRTVLVTSATPSEGKSTVAANLAIVMAQAGRKTLLIDADLRRPRTHTVFGVTREPGLTDFLHGTHAPRDLTIADQLDVFPAGSFVPNPAEFLSSKAFRDLLDMFAQSYDIIVLDAPPVMAATDPVLLSTQCDATVIVTSAGRTKEFELAYAVDEIQSVGGRIAGVVLNRFDISKEYGYRHQYSYRYGNAYSYGYNDEAR